MNILIAEAKKLIKINGKDILKTQILSANSNKYIKMKSILKDKKVDFFLKLNNSLNHYIKHEKPLILVTDWTDPTEMIGIVIEENNKEIVYPDLGFLAFYTNWDDFENSGIKKIFSHELSHLWLYNLGFDVNLSKSNKFHTVTSITDPYMAFSEGFAEHLEIVSKEISNHSETQAIYDDGLDIESWLSYRDSSLRVHAVKNNRFIYNTSIPQIDDYKDYNKLHLFHITSSSFSPESLKNGSQILASEGAVASFFYYFYLSKVFKNNYLDKEFYKQFGLEKDNVDCLTNHYIKILYTFSKMDLSSDTVLVDFVINYGEFCIKEKEQIFKLFLDMTNYMTVNIKNKNIFQELHLAGRLGDINNFKEKLKIARDFKEKTLKKAIIDPKILKQGLFKSIWLESDKLIKPVPWENELVKYKFDINTATIVDLMSLESIDIKKARKLIKTRDKINGFKDIETFNEMINE